MRSSTYPELTGFQRRGSPAPPPSFPARCPCCEAALVAKGGRRAEYACGGSYTEKPQIQNHTDVFWGHCPGGKVK